MALRISSQMPNSSNVFKLYMDKCVYADTKVRINERKTKKNLILFVMPSESTFGEAKGTDFFSILPLLQNNSVFLQQRWCEI